MIRFVVGMLSLCAVYPWTLVSADLNGSATTNTLPLKLTVKRISISGLHNIFQVAGRIYSGSQPATESEFEALARLGIKTIVSVDGSKPNASLALKYGLHYVHLPFGYDGVPTNRVAELAQAIRVKPGPFYVHCHHGLHRGPAAVAIICEANENWTSTEAINWLHEAGTSSDYPGLYRSVTEFQQPAQAELDQVVRLPEVAQTSTLVDSMVAIDEHFTMLKLSQKAGWKSPPGHPDISPSHEALMLVELLHEIPRMMRSDDRSSDFRSQMAASEKSAQRLHDILSKEADKTAATGVLNDFAQSCVTCHQSYRNRKAEQLVH